jgi:hypothetical protein
MGKPISNSHTARVVDESIFIDDADDEFNST